MIDGRPAWSRDSNVLQLGPSGRFPQLSPRWIFGDSTGAGVRVAVIDSGVEADHPLLGSAVDTGGGVELSVDASGRMTRRDGPHRDVYGHGTACAGIIHALAPQASITSVRVLDEGLRGRAAAFHAGLSWAVDERFDVINLSLGAARREWALAFHDICDRGYFGNSFIVTAANNVDRDSFPSLYASVTSVAANTARDPLRYHFNPEPPTEFLARGIDVEVPWLDGTTIVTTGNSFAAPHISGLAALIKSEHPEMRPFQVKTALWAAAANVRESSPIERAGRRGTYRLSRPASRSSGGGLARTTIDLRPAPTAPATPAPATPTPDPDPATPDPDPANGITRPTVAPGVGRGPDRPGPVGSAPVTGFPGGPSHRAVLERSPEHSPDRSPDRSPEPDPSEHGTLVERRPGVTVRRRNRADRTVLEVELEPPPATDRDQWRIRLWQLVAAAGLRHPHLVPVLELQATETSALLVLPDHRSTLAGELSTGPLTPAAAVAATVSVLRGLGAAHDAGVLHGDLRPERVVIDRSGRVAVTGLGVAAAVAVDGRVTALPTDPRGLGHLAPEQLDGAPPSPATDLHAAGLVAYRLLSGTLPHEPASDLGTLLRHRSTNGPRPLARSAPGVDRRLAAEVDRAIAPEPSRRHRSPAELEHGLLDAARRCLGRSWAASQPYVLEPD